MHLTQAILLRKTRLTESSLIVSWLSPEFGRFKTVAKGALRPKSPFQGILDLFHLCEIQFQPARSGELHSLREASLLESFPALRSRYTNIALASYAIELLEKTTESESPLPELFDLFFRVLRHLHQKPASLKALLHFESELARLLGIQSPGIPPAQVLEKLLHRLPPSRVPLVTRLSSSRPSAPL